MAPISPRTMMRSRMYGIHMTPVRMTVSVSHISSLDIAFPPVWNHRPTAD